MRRITGHQENRAAATVNSPASSERVQAQRAAWEAKRESRNAAILDYLGEERTSADVATRFKISIVTAQQVLRGMRVDGLIVSRSLRRITVYRRDENAKPLAQSKPITVRGETFPSMSACARHFGISVQAVADRIRRGATDTIVMRREAAE